MRIIQSILFTLIGALACSITFASQSFANCIGMSTNGTGSSMEIACEEIAPDSFRVDASLEITVSSDFHDLAEGTDLAAQRSAYFQAQRECLGHENRRKREYDRAVDKMDSAKRAFERCQNNARGGFTGNSQEEYENFIRQRCGAHMRDYQDAKANADRLSVPHQCVGVTADSCRDLQEALDERISDPQRRAGVCSEQNPRVGSGVFGSRFNPGVKNKAKQEANRRGYFQTLSEQYGSSFGDVSTQNKDFEGTGCSLPRKVLDECTLSFDGSYRRFAPLDIQDIGGEIVVPTLPGGNGPVTTHVDPPSQGGAGTPINPFNPGAVTATPLPGGSVFIPEPISLD